MDFSINHYSFNIGQFVLTTGLFKESDFESLVRITNGRAKKRYDFFAHNDQGVINYVVQKKEQQEKISLHREPFMIWGGSSEALQIDISLLGKNSHYDRLVHWAGAPCATGTVPYKQLLKYFEGMFVEYILNRKVK